MVTQRWDTALNANTMTFYVDAAALMKQQRIPPIVGWEADVARNYIFSLMWRCYGPKQDFLDYWGII